MTERSDGAPDPADPPAGGDAGPGSPQPAPAFWNLAAVRRSDAVVEALAARSALPAADPAGLADVAGFPDPVNPADPTDLTDPAGWWNDPAARLLRALVADVDADAPELPDRRPSVHQDQPAQPGRPAQPQAGGPGGDQGQGGGPRRGPRTIVLLGVVGPLLTGVLATTGVAAAQSGGAEWPGFGERTGREREPRAETQPGHGRPGTGRTRDGSAVTDGARRMWSVPSEVRPVVLRTGRDGGGEEAADGPRQADEIRDHRKAPRPDEPRPDEPRPYGPDGAGPREDEPRAGDPQDVPPEPRPRGVLPFVRPDAGAPGLLRDRPAVRGNAAGERLTDDTSGGRTR